MVAIVTHIFVSGGTSNKHFVCVVALVTHFFLLVVALVTHIYFHVVALVNQRTIGPENAHLKPDLGVLSHNEMTLTLNTHTP